MRTGSPIVLVLHARLQNAAPVKNAIWYKAFSLCSVMHGCG